jgi:hypothetical protein
MAGLAELRQATATVIGGFSRDMPAGYTARLMKVTVTTSARAVGLVGWGS